MQYKALQNQHELTFQQATQVHSLSRPDAEGFVTRRAFESALDRVLAVRTARAIAQRFALPLRSNRILMPTALLLPLPLLLLPQVSDAGSQFMSAPPSSGRRSHRGTRKDGRESDSWEAKYFAALEVR